ncbi:hypothetical protein TVAG_129760 [Trichomonas vaginalis G3]|uniref:Uncharacterized protein n=1 Tax=Trichomonas vaginalis (strain ATCC PRA-98 / G3) TaxID=412133 RepID=A2DI72_TRIV3|nr:hypothetical protein TVAG_129760 [Trichomonas vaginalis G3]|eukprot:XP_001580854.1 hypothetical protein [Trichomonas vaginalis G3]
MLGLGDYGEYIGQNKAKQNSQSNNNQNSQKNQQNSANPIKFSQPPTITRQSSNSSIGSLQNYTNQTPIQPDSQNKNDITGLWRDLSTDEYSIIDDDSDALPDSLFSSPSDINNSLLLKPQQKIQEPAQSSIPEVDGYPEKPPKSSSYHFFGTLSSDTSMEPIEDKKQADSITIPAEEDNNQNEDAKEEQNDENQLKKPKTIRKH